MTHLSALLREHYRKPTGGVAAIAARLGRPSEAARALLKGHRSNDGRTLPAQWIDGALSVKDPTAWDSRLQRVDVAAAFFRDIFGDEPAAEFWRDCEIACARNANAAADRTAEHNRETATP